MEGTRLERRGRRPFIRRPGLEREVGVIRANPLAPFERRQNATPLECLSSIFMVRVRSTQRERSAGALSPAVQRDERTREPRRSAVTGPSETRPNL
jgi:hypothetical protein